MSYASRLMGANPFSSKSHVTPPLTPPKTPATPPPYHSSITSSASIAEKITNEGHVAPSDSIAVKIDKPKDFSKIEAPFVTTMSYAAIRNLYFGPLAYISVQKPDGKAERLDIPKISVHLVCAHSRVIEAAVAMATSDRRSVGEIILPDGPTEAYEAMFKWIDELTISPMKKEFPVHRHTPAFIYWHCIRIAQNLGLTEIVEPLQFRLKLFSIYDKNKEDGKGFLIVPEDLERAYRELGKNHVLTQTLVKNIAAAWNDRAIFSKKHGAFTELSYEIPEFWDDLEPMLDKDKKSGAPHGWK